MKRNRDNLFVDLLKRPGDIPMYVIGGLILGIDRVFFSWWLNKLIARRGNLRFAKSIRENLSFLYTEYDARIVPNDSEPPLYFDWAKVTVEAESLLFMFTLDRGMVGVHVAPQYAPDNWQDLSAVLTFIADPEREVEFSRLLTIARELEPQMVRLKDAFSQGQFENTKAEVSNICKRKNIQARLRIQGEISRRRKYLGLLRSLGGCGIFYVQVIVEADQILYDLLASQRQKGHRHQFF